MPPTPTAIALPFWPIAEIRPLLGGGMQAWLAGGAVRDLLLGHRPHDWDFVVTGSGLRVARAVADKLRGAYYALDAERKTGRAIVTDPASCKKVTLDFAALRHGTIEQDLLARDFTLNAMAASLDGQIIDPTGGHQDLLSHSLTMVSPGCFEADSIRLLRAVRLAVQLGLTLEDATRARIEVEAQAITNTAPERTRTELVALMGLPTAAQGLALLADLGLLSYVLPELGRTAHSAKGQIITFGDEVSHRIEVVAALVRQHEALALCSTQSQSSFGLDRALADGSPTALAGLNAYLAENVGAETTRGELVRWAALFAPSSQSADEDNGVRQAIRRMSELRFCGPATDFVGLILASRRAFDALVTSQTLTNAGAADDTAGRRAIYRYYRDARDGGVAAALLVLAADGTLSGHQPTVGWSPHVETARILIEAYFTRRGTTIDPLPLLSGHDLLALGVPPGPPVGRHAALLREAQATGEVHTEAQARTYVLRTLLGSDNPNPGHSGGPA